MLPIIISTGSLIAAAGATFASAYLAFITYKSNKIAIRPIFKGYYYINSENENTVLLIVENVSRNIANNISIKIKDSSCVSCKHYENVISGIDGRKVKFCGPGDRIITVLCGEYHGRFGRKDIDAILTIQPKEKIIINFEDVNNSPYDQTIELDYNEALYTSNGFLEKDGCFTSPGVLELMEQRGACCQNRKNQYNCKCQENAPKG